MKTADGDAGRTAVRRRARGGKQGRAKPALITLSIELANEPEAAVAAPDANPIEPPRRVAVGFNYDTLDWLISGSATFANYSTGSLRLKEPFAGVSRRDDPEEVG